MTFVEAEIASQPDCWRRAIVVARDLSGSTGLSGATGLSGTAALGNPGERLALIGCGTSWFVAQVAAAWRESAGLGETDAFTASEVPDRSYDRVIAITRSGTTTEVLEVLHRVQGSIPTTVVLGDLATPAPELADIVVDLSFADEQSVVQTRFATSALVLFRAAWRGDVDGLPEAAAQAVAADMGVETVGGHRTPDLPLQNAARRKRIRLRRTGFAYGQNFTFGATSSCGRASPTSKNSR